MLDETLSHKFQLDSRGDDFDRVPALVEDVDGVEGNVFLVPPVVQDSDFQPLDFRQLW